MSNTDYVEEVIENDDPTVPLGSEETRIAHTVLRAWHEVLSNWEKESEQPVTMPVAVRVLGNHPYIRLHELEEYSKRFYEVLEDAYLAVDFEVQGNKAALENVENDAEANREIYLNILMSWQMILRKREREWNVNDLNSGPELAAYIDAAAFLVGESGLAAHLGAIQFAFTQEDSQAIYEAVNEQLETEDQ